MRSTRRKQTRRGSTLVMVGVMLVAFMGVGAIAADIGRFYVVTGELQTAADAAALVGAQTLQMTASATPKPAVDASVITFVGGTNRSNDSALVVTSDSVKLAFWTPQTVDGNGTIVPANLDYVLNGRRANAVYVGVGNAPKGVFAQIIGRTTGLALQRNAVAWIGNVSLQCIRPFAFPYAPFYRRVNNLAPNTSWPDSVPSVTAGAMAAYQQTSVANRTFIVLPPEAPYPYQYPSDSSWRGYNPPSNQNGNANSGKSTFQSFVEGCSGVSVNSDAGSGNTVPNSGNGNSCNAVNQTVCWTIDVLTKQTSGGVTTGICAFKTALDAGCYESSSAATPGVIVDIAWSDIVGNGQSVDFRYVGEFELKCFFEDPAQTCADIPGAQKTNYPVGTIVGVSAGLKSRILKPTDIISNSPSNVQRLLLVQ
jgi:Flp pilus assembly protein TadG